MSSRKSNLFVSIAVIVFGFAAVFALSKHLEKTRPPLPEGYADQDLALQGARLKGYALGFEGLIADWYWMQSLQYIGSKILDNPEADISIDDLNALNPRLLYPYLDNATTLDPRFIAPYSYGAFVLPAIDKEQAIKISLKGIENNPGNWYLYHQLGYIYWKTEDYRKAEETYTKGSLIAGAPPFMKFMAANMKTRGGSRETARAMYEQMAAEAPDPKTREAVKSKLDELDSLDERDAISAVLREFQAKYGRCAGRWSEIFPMLRAIKPPNGRDFRLDEADNIVDPGGEPYVLDTENCSIRLGPRSKIPRN